MTTWSPAAQRLDRVVTAWFALNVGACWALLPSLQLACCTLLCALGVLLLWRETPRGKYHALVYVVGWLAGMGAIQVAIRAAPGGEKMAWSFGVLWMVALFLGSPNLAQRANAMVSLGTVSAVLTLMTLSLKLEAPQRLAATLLVAANILVFLAVSHHRWAAFHQEAPAAIDRKAPWSTVATVALAAVLAAGVGLPLAWAKHAWSPPVQEWLPGFLPFGPSRDLVFTATFEDAAPKEPYWVYAHRYVWPTGESDWEGTPAVHHALDLAGRQDVISAHFQLDRMESAGARHVYTMDRIAPVSVSVELSGWVGLEPPSPGSQTPRHIAHEDGHPVPHKGFTPELDALYLGIPAGPGPFDPSRGVNQSGAAALMPKTLALVQSWKREGLSDAELVVRALSYFQDNFAYHFGYQSTDPEENRVDGFVFEQRKGVCRHFANTFALMMRMAGIRSRVVAGFRGGEYHPAARTWVVRGSEAHAWTEVWLDGHGWLRVDPTAVVPVEKGMPEARGGLWERWFGARDSSVSSFKPFSTKGEAGGLRELPAPGGAVLAIVCLAILALAGWGGALYRARRARSPEEQAWRRIVALLRRRKIPVQPHHGPASVGRLVAPSLPPDRQADWLAAVAAYERWKFAGRPDPALREALDAQRAVLKKHLR